MSSSRSLKHVTTPRAVALSFIVGTIAILLLRAPAPVFLYDAAQYWTGATAVVSGEHVYTLGGLATRGVLSSLMYVPAALAVDVLGLTPTGASWAVFAQNALAISALGALVIPLILRRFIELRPGHVLLSTTLTVVLLSGFAPYPLMDLPALLALFVGVLLVADRRWWLLALGGVLLATAVNLRPAYLVPVLLVAVLLLAYRRVRGLAALAGGAIPLALQAWYGWRATGVITPWPPGTATVTAIQLNYASYGVRYDTVPYVEGDPRQWYCSPDMAEHAVGNLPATTGDLMSSYVAHIPESILFALEKVTATLQWSSSTPYSGPGVESLRLLGFLAVAVTAIGMTALVAALRRGRGDRFVPLALLLSVIGCSIVIVGSAPEPRFAAPLVTAGVVGTCLMTSSLVGRRRAPRGTMLRAAGVATLLAVLTIAVGAHGMRHAAPRGDVTAETCVSSAADANAEFTSGYRAPAVS